MRTVRMAFEQRGVQASKLVPEFRIGGEEHHIDVLSRTLGWVEQGEIVGHAAQCQIQLKDGNPVPPVVFGLEIHLGLV